MGIKMYREYRIKFYLNAQHYIIINNKKGETHPHTWEFSILLRYSRTGFTTFNTFENGINEYLNQYQNKVMNEVEPFTNILPTLENITDQFAQDFAEIIAKVGGRLISLESSETPTRSYIVKLDDDEEMDPDENVSEQEMIDQIIDSVVDEVLDDSSNEPAVPEFENLGASNQTISDGAEKLEESRNEK